MAKSMLDAATYPAKLERDKRGVERLEAEEGEDV
jgi:hypothetical protein